MANRDKLNSMSKKAAELGELNRKAASDIAKDILCLT
jgi:hypothetical protein